MQSFCYIVEKYENFVNGAIWGLLCRWMPGQRRDVTYVSRLQCVQAAIETQLEKLAKEHPKTKVGIGTICQIH
jgi:hypothetical protein